MTPEERVEAVRLGFRMFKFYMQGQQGQQVQPQQAQPQQAQPMPQETM